MGLQVKLFNKTTFITRPANSLQVLNEISRRDVLQGLMQIEFHFVKTRLVHFDVILLLVVTTECYSKLNQFLETRENTSLLQLLLGANVV